MAKVEPTEAERAALLMQALGNQYGRLQSARGATIAESSSRTSLYLTSLTGAVVSLSFVAQASRFTETFFVFALVILPVVFFLGVITYYRVLQTGVEDVIYARAMSKIQQFYGDIDPAHGDLFHSSSVDQVGLSSLGYSAFGGSSSYPPRRWSRSSIRSSRVPSSRLWSPTSLTRLHGVQSAWEQ